MPYIAIKAYPKDQATKVAAVEKINEILLEIWGCPQEAITISIEEVKPEDWKERIAEREIEPNMANMMIRAGKRYYSN